MSECCVGMLRSSVVLERSVGVLCWSVVSQCCVGI